MKAVECLRILDLCLMKGYRGVLREKNWKWEGERKSRGGPLSLACPRTSLIRLVTNQKEDYKSIH